jgi:hypothetical protein
MPNDGTIYDSSLSSPAKFLLVLVAFGIILVAELKRLLQTQRVQ